MQRLWFFVVCLPSLATAQSPSVAPVARAATSYVPNTAADLEARARDSSAGLQWMVSPRRDLAHYSIPMCLNAIDAIDMETRARTLHDTVQRGRASDTLSTAARTFARTCAARWPLAAAPSRDLRALVQLALAAGDIPLALAAIDRRIRERPKGGSTESVLLDGIEAVGATIPLRLDVADTLNRRAVASNAGVDVWAVLAGKAYADLLDSVIYDTTRILSVRARNLAALRSLSSKDRIYAGYTANYWLAREQADIYARRPIDSITVALSRNQTLELVEAAPPVRPPGWANEWYNRADLVNEFSYWQEQAREYTAQLGTLVPAVTGGYWFPAPADTAPVAAVPKLITGHATLFIKVGRSDASTDRRKAFVRRLYDRYAARGLDIIIVDQTQGWAWNSPPLMPRDEAKVVAWYVHDVCDLPLPVLIDPTFAAAFIGNGPSDTYPLLVGRDGRLFSYGLRPDDRSERIVRQALGLPETDTP